MKSNKQEDQTNEEIVKRIQNATDPRDDLEKLYNKNEGLIWRAIKSFRGQSDFDDLKQEAYLIMHEAALKYDPGVGANFATEPVGVALEAWPPVLEYTSVSSTRMLTSWFWASTWSTPP